MLSLFGKIFGTEKALSDVVKSASSAMDALVYTDEEKAQDAAKERAEGRQMVVAWMQSTQGQNIARRLIAVTITGMWALSKLVAFGLAVGSAWSNENAERYLTSAELAGEMVSDMDPAVMLILGFYFAAPYMGEIAKTALDKMKK